MAFHIICSLMTCRALGAANHPESTKWLQKLGVCVLAVSNWCASKRLQLNTKKTEIMSFGSATTLGKLSSADQHVQDGPGIRVFFDSEPTMKSHIS